MQHNKKRSKQTSEQTIKPADMFIEIPPSRVVTRSQLSDDFTDIYNQFGTYKATGEAIGLSGPYISRLRNGYANPGKKALECLSKALGETIERQYTYFRAPVNRHRQAANNVVRYTTPKGKRVWSKDAKTGDVTVRRIA